jgi:DNA-binding NarL/FixJ family response regulator
VVLTNSIRPEDLTRSLELGAAAFHVKTSEHEAEPALVRALESLLDQRVGVLP